MLKKNFKIFLFLVLFFLLGAGFVYALEITYPRVPGAVPPQDFLITAPAEDILSLYAKYLINLCIWAAGIIAFAGLVYGGVLYLISTGKPDRMASAKNQISAAFFGLLLLLSSFIILKTLNPQFTNLKIPTLKEVQIPVKPEVLLPETTIVNSSIDIEMPFARVIEKIFETYISDYPEPEQKETPRMERIKNYVRAIVSEGKDTGIADKLKKQSEALKGYSDACQCFNNTKPDPSCEHDECYECPPKYCSSDPCSPVRQGIQNKETENQAEINNLALKQTEIEKEVRLLKEWLERLKRAEKFIKECPLRSLNSLAQFYSKKDTFDNNDWIIRETKFWDDVSIRYYTGKYTKDQYGSWYYIPTKEIGTDFATFYCAASGTLEQEYPFSTPAPDESKLTGEESVEEAEEILSESMACSSEAPVGEIIDRAKRTAQLLIDKLEMLVGKNKELIDAVDELQVLISQCSSRRCEPECECFCSKAGCWCVEIGCFGAPCPSGAISDQLGEIQRIWGEIRDIIEGKDSNDTPSNIGIIPIIEEVIPEILKDLEDTVRIPMKECSSEDWLEQDTVLFNCLQAKGATIPPEQKTLYTCCQTEYLDQDQLIQTAYGNCFEECYLEIGQEKHRECVWLCLNKASGQPENTTLPECIHELNFYCCHVK